MVFGILTTRPVVHSSNNQEENKLMSLRRIGSAVSLLLLSLSTTAAFAADAKTPATPITAERYGTWGFDIEGMDRNVKPGDDFFKYVNGAWLAKTQIPADKTAYGAFAVLGDLSEARVHALLDKWAADKSLKAGSDEAKVAAIAPSSTKRPPRSSTASRSSRTSSASRRPGPMTTWPR